MPTRSPPDSGHFASADGTRLYYEDTLIEGARAALLIVHGFGDHCGRYADLAAHFNERGFSTLRFDYRGHGRADGRRGHIFEFEDYLKDLRAFRARAKRVLPPELPCFLLAHSNGGLIATHGVAEDPTGLRGLCLSSPFYGFAIKVPAWKSVLGRGLSRLVPALSLPTDIDPSIVSHDPAVVQGYATDPLVGHVASARWLTETSAAQERLAAAAAQITLPLLMQQAGEDKLASAEAAKRGFDAFGSSDKTFTPYPGLFHEIWFERDRQPVIAELATWLDAHLDGA